MKRVVAFVLAAMLLLAVAACGKQEKPGEPAEPAPTEPTPMSDEARLESIKSRLEIPMTGVLPCVFDTDTWNEIDDQFALAYLMRHSDRFDVKAIYAAPFVNSRASTPDDGMRRSFDEIVKILRLMQIEYDEDFVLNGSTSYIENPKVPEISPAALDLVTRAKEYTPEAPLYVIATGCITNVANALIIAPEIRDNIVVIWLGGHTLNYPTNDEYNLRQDIAAARIVLQCGTAMIHVACNGCTSYLTTTVTELEPYMKDKSDICDYLLQILDQYMSGHKVKEKVLWDVGAVAYLVNPGWFDGKLVKALSLADDCSWIESDKEHVMKTLTYCRRSLILNDFLKMVAK